MTGSSCEPRCPLLLLEDRRLRLTQLAIHSPQCGQIYREFAALPGGMNWRNQSSRLKHRQTNAESKRDTLRFLRSALNSWRRAAWFTYFEDLMREDSRSSILLASSPNSHRSCGVSKPTLLLREVISGGKTSRIASLRMSFVQPSLILKSIGNDAAYSTSRGSRKGSLVSIEKCIEFLSSYRRSDGRTNRDVSFLRSSGSDECGSPRSGFLPALNLAANSASSNFCLIRSACSEVVNSRGMRRHVRSRLSRLSLSAAMIFFFLRRSKTKNLKYSR